MNSLTHFEKDEQSFEREESSLPGIQGTEQERGVWARLPGVSMGV